MARSIIAVIVSYILMFILAFLSFTAVYLVVGADNAFKPHSYMPSNRWIAAGLAIQFVVGIIGGLICAAIAKGVKAPLALAVVTLVLGLALGSLAMMKPRTTEARTSSQVPMFEAMQKANPPKWEPFAIPFVAAVGVLIGGRLKRRG